VPQNCQSLVLISDDPDAPDPQNPKMTWVHWVVYDLPPDSSGLDERQPKEGTLANGAKQGITDFGSIGYGGPCPPIGEHRYYFKLYALDTRLDLPPGQSKKNIEEAMAGHILEQAELIGLYQKKGT
jgi:Raf kinase inhibitor-like YbhB/YbcL family protein